jgi:hypothetical protein
VNDEAVGISIGELRKVTCLAASPNISIRLDTNPLLPDKRFHAKAVLLGERMDPRGYVSGSVLAINPLTVSFGDRQVAVLFH